MENLHHTQWSKTECFPSKIKNKPNKSILAHFIVFSSLHFTRGSSEGRTKNKGIQIRNEDVKLSVHDMVTWGENPKQS